MSIFRSIMSAIFGKAQAAPSAGSSAATDATLWSTEDCSVAVLNTG